MILACNLAFVAGSVDAEGYLFLHGSFVSFMSGNSTKGAVGIGTGNGPAVELAAALIALFVCGVALGTLAGGRGRWRQRRVLVTVAAILAVAGAVEAAGAGGIAIGMAAAAMGALNAALPHADGVRLSATYMTGTLVKLGQELAEAARGGRRWGWVPYAMLWSGLTGGAVAGAALYPAIGLGGLWAAAGWCAVSAAVSRADPGR
ncbi:MAG: DUF1275 family protein [Gluconacetobacter diazotrophicus]|nr:DUF1275 family protein [Gluconacetobacter diazotrophicus]